MIGSMFPHHLFCICNVKSWQTAFAFPTPPPSTASVGWSLKTQRGAPHLIVRVLTTGSSAGTEALWVVCRGIAKRKEISVEGGERKVKRRSGVYIMGWWKTFVFPHCSVFETQNNCYTCVARYVTFCISWSLETSLRKLDTMKTKGLSLFTFWTLFLLCNWGQKAS